MANAYEAAERLEIREAIKRHDIALSLARTVELAALLDLPDDMIGTWVGVLRERLESASTGHYKVAKAIGGLADAFVPHEVMLTGEAPADDEPTPTLTLKTLADILYDVSEPPRVTLPLRSIQEPQDPPVEEEADADDSWRDDALCAQIDGNMFFPDKGGSTREAKRICAECTVARQCLKFALEHDERFGIWGGLSERERRRLKRTNGGESSILRA